MIFGNYTDKLYKFPHSNLYVIRTVEMLYKKKIIMCYAWGIQWYISNKQVIPIHMYI